tara:strand:+ start:725 stop:1207 length:483 start_codon:yes stop_codon:yes gene_type:complete
MNNKDLDAYVRSWVNKLNDTEVCPYAKSVYDSSKLKLIELEPPEDVYEFWRAVSEQAELYDGSIEVVMVAMPTNKEIITIDQMVGATDSLNGLYNYKDKDLWFLDAFFDHWTIMLLQKISALDDASAIFQKKDYYKEHHPYRYKKYVQGRRNLRNRLTKT